MPIPISVIKWPNPDLKPHPPHYRLGKPSNGQKITMKQDWYSNQGFQPVIFWVLGERDGRRKEARLRWQDIELSDQTGLQLAVRVRNLGSTSDSKSTAISTFGQRFRRHLWEVSGMQKNMQNVHKYAKNTRKIC